MSLCVYLMTVNRVFKCMMTTTSNKVKFNDLQCILLLENRGIPSSSLGSHGSHNSSSEAQ
jgi:hypothetical protein